MSRLELPDDGWAELADPKKVTERRRKPVVRAMAALLTQRKANPTPAPSPGEAADDVTVSEAELDAMSTLAEAVMVALVASWSYPVEISTDAVADLPGDAYDVLRSACNASLVALLPNFAVGPDPKAPPTSGS